MIILGNRVLIKKLPEPAKVEGQFETVQAGDDFLFKGEVVMIGTDLDYPIKQGNTILFSAYSPDIQQVTVEGEIMKIITIQDVLAIL